VYTAEDVFACPQVEARGMLMPVEDKSVGRYQFTRTTPHLSAAPELPRNPAPDLSEHGREIMTDLLGYSESEWRILREKGVIG